MIKHRYESGAAIELFSANERRSDVACARVFDKGSKSFVYSLESPTAHLTLTRLRVQQAFLVLQVLIISESKFTLELGCLDNLGQRRRLAFSASTREVVRNTQHARLPNGTFRRNIWLNLSIDLQSCFGFGFPGHTCKMVEWLSCSSFSRVRRILVMKDPLIDSEDGSVWGVALPKALDFPQGVHYSSQLMRADRLSKMPPQPASSLQAYEDLRPRGHKSALSMPLQSKASGSCITGQVKHLTAWRKLSAPPRLTPITDSSSHPQTSFSGSTTPLGLRVPSFNTVNSALEHPRQSLAEALKSVVLPRNTDKSATVPRILDPQPSKRYTLRPKISHKRLEASRRFQSQLIPDDEKFEEIEESIEDLSNKLTSI